VRRLLRGFLTILFVLTLVFVITRVTGDPTEWLLSDDASAEARAALRTHLGLDRSVPEQFMVYLQQVASGDFGTSFYEHRPVTTVFFERLPATLELMGLAVLLALLLGVTLGVAAALNRNGWLDRLLMAISFSAYAVPNFVLGIILILFFSLYLRALPSAGYGTWQHYVMPVVTLGASYAALIARITRSSMLDVMGQDYVRTARSKGLSEFMVVAKHALRNALTPILTLMGLLAAGLVGGSVVIETVFAWPGAGRLIVNAVLRRDFPVLQLAVLCIAATVVVVNMIVDMSYALVDPRIEHRN
jgi:ABC-type dipeptide/oligopeptide/nickel transport system permease component